MRLAGLLPALLPWIFWPTTRMDLPFLIPKGWVAALGLAGVCLLIGREGRARPEDAAPALRHDPLAWGAAAILCGLFLSALASPAPGLGLVTGVREASFVLTALLMARHRPRPAEWRWALGALILSTLAMSVLAFAQAFAPGLLRVGVPLLAAGLGWRGAMIGTLGNPEFLASWLSAGLVAAALAAAAGPSSLPAPARWWRWTARLTALTTLGILFLSGGRGAILAAAGAGTLTMIRGQGFPRIGGRGLAIAGGVVAVLAGAWAGLGPAGRAAALPARLADLGDLHSPSLRHRLGLYTLTSRMIADHPWLGAGPGRYGAAYAETLADGATQAPGLGVWAHADLLNNEFVGAAHSDPLQWWAEYGLLPVLGLAWMLAVALGRGGRCPQRRALWGGLLTLALGCWVSFPLHEPARAVTFWILLGLVAGAPYDPAADTHPSKERSDGH